MCTRELVPRSGFVPLVSTECLTLLHPDVLGRYPNKLAPVHVEVGGANIVDQAF